jgi:hypothetical protein
VNSPRNWIQRDASLPVRVFDKEHQFGVRIKVVVAGLYVVKA